MNRQPLLASLKTYQQSPFFMDEEQSHYDQLLTFINDNPRCFERDNHGHVTGSVWLINHDHTHVLLTHHKKLDRWLQLGGHADGDHLIHSVAMKEAQEESGIEGLSLVTEEIFDIDIHAIPNKCAYHYDIRYVIKAPQGAQYNVSEESHDLAWVALDKLTDYTTSRSVLRMAEKNRLV